MSDPPMREVVVALLYLVMRNAAPDDMDSIVAEAAMTRGKTAIYSNKRLEAQARAYLAQLDPS